MFSPKSNASSSIEENQLNFSTDRRPSDAEYALLCQHVYEGSKIKKGSTVKYGNKTWKAKSIFEGSLSYFGVLYIETATRQAVLAHRGTQVTKIGTVIEDILGICLNKTSPQKESIFGFVAEALEFSKEVEYHLSFTGHSLGAFLAEVSVYYCHKSLEYPDANAVTFESPGCRESLEKLQSNLSADRIDLDSIDIVGYLSYPNLINTCNHHVGSLYAVEPDVKTKKIVLLRDVQVHGIDNIVKSLLAKDVSCSYILDWPLGSQGEYFFKNAQFENGCYTIPENDELGSKQQFDLDYKGHYQLHPVWNNFNALPLIHFAQPARDWLRRFYKNLKTCQKVFGLDRAKLLSMLVESAGGEGSRETMELLLSCTVVKKKLLQVVVDGINVAYVREKVTGWLEDNKEISWKLTAIQPELPKTIPQKLLRIKEDLLSNSDLTNELATYIPVQAGRYFDDKEFFDLDATVAKFLKNDAKVLLLLGDSGSGKSTYGRFLERKLWQGYDGKGPIPFFISLPEQTDCTKQLIENFFLHRGFSPEQILTLRKEEEFIFILDGYDEAMLKTNIYISNKFSGWKAKVIISCRSQYLLSKREEYQSKFLPDRDEQPEASWFQEMVLKPFSSDQIDEYLKKYVEVVKPVWSDWQKYRKHIDAISDIREMITNPFLLRVVAEVLPEVIMQIERSQTQDHTSLTRANLYDAFVERWFDRQELKIKKQGLIEADVEVKEAFWDFSKRLATKMFQQGLVVVEYVPPKKVLGKQTQATDSEWAEFFSDDKELSIIRSGCPIQSRGQNKWSFVHKSLLEYFGVKNFYLKVAQKTVPHTQREFLNHEISPKNAEEIILTNQGTPAIEIKDAIEEKPKEKPIATMAMLEDLNKRLLNDEPSMIGFFSDMVKKDEKTKEALFAIVEKSKTDSSVKIAAANAMSVLNRAQVSFAGMDLRGIAIPNAILAGAILDFADLETADLTDVILCQSSLVNTNLKNCKMKGVFFGERSSLSYEDHVGCAAYSPDGLFRAVGSGKNVYIYDMSTTLIIDIFTHSSDVTTISWHPNANLKLLASGDDKGGMSVWDGQKKENKHKKLNGHSAQIHSISWHPNPKLRLLASACDDAIILVWDGQKNYKSRELKGHSHYSCVVSVSWHPNINLKLLASGSWDNTVRIWDGQSDYDSRELSGHESRVLFVSWHPNPDFKLLASASEDGAIRVWDGSKYYESVKLEGHTSYIFSIGWHPNINLKLLASGSSDNTARIWDGLKNYESLELKGHLNAVRIVSWHPNPALKLLATGGEDRTIRIWDGLNNYESYVLKGHTCPVTIINWYPDASSKFFIAVGRGEYYVRVWDGQRNYSITESKGHIDSVYSVNWHSDISLKLLASGSADGTIRIWDGRKHYESRELNCDGKNDDAVNSVSWHPGSEQKLLASGLSGCKIRLWNGQKNYEQTELKDDGEGYVHSVCWFPNPKLKLLASGGYGEDSKVVRVFDGHKNYEFQELKGHANSIKALVWHPNQEIRLLASGGEDNTLRIWDGEKNYESIELKGHSEPVSSISWHPNDNLKLLASGSFDNTVRIWDGEKNYESVELNGHSSYVFSVIWYPSPKQKLLVSGSKTDIRVWNGEHEYNCVFVLETGNPVCSMSFTLAGKELAAGFQDASVRVYSFNKTDAGINMLLMWRSTPILYCNNACIEDALLSSEDASLLKQRDAKGEAKITISDKPSAMFTKVNSRNSVGFEEEIESTGFRGDRETEEREKDESKKDPENKRKKCIVQ